MGKKILAIWAGVMLSVMSFSTAFADETDDRIKELESQISVLQEELNELKAQKRDAEGNTDIETAASAVEVLGEYTLSDGIGWYTRHFIVLKNNSDSTLDIETSSLAYSEDGTMVGAASSTFDALGPGCVSVLYEAFETDEIISYYETDINSSPSEYYESVLEDLSYVQNDIKNGAVFQVTNNGSEPAEFVEGYALFFLDDELVDYQSTYFVDNDSEIKPGATISEQLTVYEAFDRIEFYLTGRR